MAHGADLGIAHDGDADRCLAVDHEGNEVDGDQIMAILAVALKDSGKLTDNVLVATVMSNLGLKIALREAGISIRETGVGDRYVLEEMRDGGFNLGGEQSGHVIFADHATTGDGVLTGLQLAAQVALTGKPLKELATVMTKLPQVLINVKDVDRSPRRATRPSPQAVRIAEAELGDTGRVLLRPSGTEPWCASWWRPGARRPRRSSPTRLAQVVKTELALGRVPSGNGVPGWAKGPARQVGKTIEKARSASPLGGVTGRRLRGRHLQLAVKRVYTRPNTSGAGARILDVGRAAEGHLWSLTGLRSFAAMGKFVLYHHHSYLHAA